MYPYSTSEPFQVTGLPQYDPQRAYGGVVSSIIMTKPYGQNQSRANLFLRGLYESSGGRRTAISPVQWMAIANNLGFDDAERRDAKDRLLSRNLISMAPATEALTLTFEGIDEAEGHWTSTQQHSLHDPLPGTPSEILDELNYWTKHQNDGEPGSDHWIAVDSRLTSLRSLLQVRDDGVGAASHQGLLVFISHSSHDEALAAALVRLPTSAIGLVSDQVRCSSVDGYRLPVGVNSEDTLRNEVNAARVVVGLITPSSLASHFVMFELGARWGATRFLAPLLAGVKPHELKSPLNLLNALSAHSSSQLHQLVRDIAIKLGRTPQSPASYSTCLDLTKQRADGTATAAIAQAPDSDASVLTALQQENSSLTIERNQLRDQLAFRAAVQRIAGHSYVQGRDEEICSRCAEVDSRAITLLDMNIDGRGLRATCPHCKTAKGRFGPPVLRKRAEETAHAGR
jgi:hypothetical protein